jgi:hypothetical protein
MEYTIYQLVQDFFNHPGTIHSITLDPWLLVSIFFGLQDDGFLFSHIT